MRPLPGQAPLRERIIPDRKTEVKRVRPRRSSRRKYRPRSRAGRARRSAIRQRLPASAHRSYRTRRTECSCTLFSRFAQPRFAQQAISCGGGDDTGKTGAPPVFPKMAVGATCPGAKAERSNVCASERAVSERSKPRREQSRHGECKCPGFRNGQALLRRTGPAS